LGYLETSIEAAKTMEGAMPASYDREKRVFLYRVPLGVIGAIQPWNMPIEIASLQVLPALLTGNCVVEFAERFVAKVTSDIRLGLPLDDATTLGSMHNEPTAAKVDNHVADAVANGARVLAGGSRSSGWPTPQPGEAPPMPALPIGAHGRRAAKGMNALGWHWWPGSNAIASQPYGRLGQCVRRATCMTGCPDGAKATVDMTLWPDAIGAGAKLLTGARVERITIDEHGRASGADWIDRDGRCHHQAADLVVMAANGIGTPRLLLLSAGGRFPAGLANSSGLIGKRLMMHPYLSVLGIYEEDMQSWLGPFGMPVCSMEFAETDWSRGFPRGAKLNVMPVPGPTYVLARLAGLPLSQRLGSAMHELVARALGRSFEWAVSIEDLPDETNTVTLDPELTDGDGLPAPRLRYRMSDWSKKSLAWHSQRAVEAHEAAGAIEIHPFDYDPEGGWHLMGTARMGDDPERSVVDPYGRTHDVPNLFVADASVFVTSSTANPTPTLTALALRTADHIVETARDQVVAA
jgi:choline dehydrogenase-like flavoprotein